MTAVIKPQAPKSIRFDEIADRLKNNRVSSVIAGYREFHVCIKRNVAVAVLIAWALYWSRGAVTAPPDNWKSLPLDQVLPIEAVEVLPWLLGFFVASLVWTILLRTGKIQQTHWVDVVGATANLIGIGVMINVAWNLSLFMITVMPLVSIIIGARFGRPAFYLSMAFTVFVVAISAPEGYWLKRPAFGVFALVLLVGLPMTVYRLLSALWTVSEQAVLARETQNRFIATMSHELRTPLNSLVNFAILIDEDKLPADQQILMKYVVGNANALLHRVNAVLDVAGIDGGRMSLISEPFRVTHLLSTVQAVCGSHAKERDVSLTLDLDPAADINVVSDGGRIEQALTNLVTNAIKFTPAGGRVTLSVRRLNQGDTQPVAELQFRVVDTGPGIPDHLKKEVFNPFRQLSEGPSRRFGGIGLGLYIVKSISDLLAGTIEVTDTPGGGTTFTWTMALKLAKDQTATKPMTALEALAEHSASHPTLHCVCFEDTPSNQIVIQRMLDLAGHKVTFFNSGENAIERMQGADLVLLDLHMPGESGYDVLDVVRKTKYHLPPIVVMTADTTKTALDAMSDAGVAGYLPKPIVAKQLLDILDRAHHQFLSQREF